MPDVTRDILETLIETCRDGETGYLHSASVARDSELKSYFQQQSLERARFRAELTDAITQLGEPDPDTSGSSTAGFTERGSNSKVISEEEITRCWKALSREKTAQSTLMKVRWKRNSPQELTSWCAIIMPA